MFQKKEATKILAITFSNLRKPRPWGTLCQWHYPTKSV